MNNKKGIALTKEWSQKLERICQKAHQNQLNLESFYRTNKLKFPPLLQSKNIILNNFNNSIIQQSTQQIEKSEIKQEDKNDMTYFNRSQSSTKSRLSICPIIFKHIRGRKSSFVHANNSKLGKSKTIDIDKGVSKTVAKNTEKNNIKFINEDYTPKNSLSTIFNSFNTSRSFINYNRVADRKESIDLSSEDYMKNQLNQSLLVNNAVTVNPQRLFLQSLNRSRTHLLGVERQLIVKRNSRLDNKRISIYKNSYGIVPQKKKPVQKPKQMGKFQPWPMTNPEDQIHEIEYPEMKSCKI